MAKSANEVDLTWTASSDVKGVTGYEIVRNGVLLTQVSGTTLSYADTTVASTTTYNYSIKAFDGSSLYSAGSNVVAVTTPAASSGPTPTSCPAPATGQFTGCYYNNVLWLGTPSMVRTDSQINFNWTKSPPSPAIPYINFSAKWQGYFNFAGGNYVFTLNLSGGMNLYIDGELIAPSPQGVSPHLSYEGATLSPGQHLITINYFNSIGNPSVQVSWQLSQ
jgi:hypothetical protein